MHRYWLVYGALPDRIRTALLCIAARGYSYVDLEARCIITFIESYHLAHIAHTNRFVFLTVDSLPEECSWAIFVVDAEDSHQCLWFLPVIGRPIKMTVCMCFCFSSLRPHARLFASWCIVGQKLVGYNKWLAR